MSPIIRIVVILLLCGCGRAATEKADTPAPPADILATAPTPGGDAAGGGIEPEKPRPAPARVEEKAGWKTSEYLLLPADKAKEANSDDVWVSPDGIRTAYIRAEGKQKQLVVDGKPGKLYDHIYSFGRKFESVFFDGGKRFAYLAKDGRKTLVVVDEKEVHEFDAVAYNEFYVRPGDKNWACLGERDKQTSLYIDGKPVQRVVLKEDFLYTSGHWLTLEIDDKSQLWHVVVDGRRDKGYGFIDAKSFALHPSGAYAYSATPKIGESEYCVVNGKESRPYEVISMGQSKFISFALTQDTKVHAFYAYNRGLKQGYLVIDGQVRPAPEEHRLPEGIVHDVQLSRDGKHWACAVSNGGKSHVIRDGKRVGGEYDHVGIGTGITLPSLTFSPDGTRLGFVAAREGKTFERYVVIDGTEHPIGGGAEIVFSPDSKRVAYDSWTAGKVVVVDDGKEGNGYDRIERGTLGFGRGEQSLIYVARTAKEGEAGVLVIDGQERTRYEKIIPRSSKTIYVGENSYSYVAVRNGAYFWVEERRIAK